MSSKVSESRKQKADNRKLPANLEPVGLVAGQSGLVLLAFVHWFAGTNKSRHATNKLRGNAKNPGLFEAIRDGGWKPEHAPVVIPMSATESKQAVAERKGLVAAWQASDDETENQLAKVMSAVWCPAGEYVVPKFKGHTGNSRGTSLPWILASLVEKSAGENREVDLAGYSIPVVVREYASAMDALIDQIQENSDRTLKGVANLSGADQLVAAKAIMSAGGSEADVQRALGQRGAAQKAFKVIKAGLMDRCLLPAPDGFAKQPEYVAGGYIPYSKVRQDKLGEAMKEGKVESYLRSAIEGTVNATKVADRKVWESLQAASQPGSPMRLIADCHLAAGGFQDVFAKYPELYDANYVGSVAEPTASVAKVATAKSGRKGRK